MFRVLSTRVHQEALYIQQLVYLYLFFCVLCRLAASRVGVELHFNTPKKYTSCCIYSASWWWVNKCSKHVAAINRNKLKANGASYWSCCTDILRCTVNRTLRLNYLYQYRCDNFKSSESVIAFWLVISIKRAFIRRICKWSMFVKWYVTVLNEICRKQENV
jgi:hypothetical protein